MMMMMWLQLSKVLSRMPWQTLMARRPSLLRRRVLVSLVARQESPMLSLYAGHECGGAWMPVRLAASCLSGAGDAGCSGGCSRGHGCRHDLVVRLFGRRLDTTIYYHHHEVLRHVEVHLPWRDGLVASVRWREERVCAGQRVSEWRRDRDSLSMASLSQYGRLSIYA